MKLSNRASRVFGKFARCEFIAPLQWLINSVYVKLFHIDLSEFDRLSSYKSLNALFTRALKINRGFDESPSVLIAPSDSLITESATSAQKQALQIKGMSYSIEELLGQKLESELFYINFYLSPRDYHRYHAPCDMEILELRYFSGELLAVNEPSLKKHTAVFVKNERVVVVAKTKAQKWLYFVAVGALNVGSIIMHFESKLHTNTECYPKGYNVCYTYRTPIHIKKGVELGMFQMGSTIVLLGESIESSLTSGTKVKFGDSIGAIA